MLCSPASPWGTLLPKLAEDELGADAFGTSMLFATMGVGTLLASLTLASIGQLKNAGGWFMFALITSSVMMVGLGLIKVYAIVLGFMFITGISAGGFMNLNQTLIQAHSPPRGHGPGHEHPHAVLHGRNAPRGTDRGFRRGIRGRADVFRRVRSRQCCRDGHGARYQRSMRRVSTVPSESVQPAPAAANVPA